MEKARRHCMLTVESTLHRVTGSMTYKNMLPVLRLSDTAAHCGLDKWWQLAAKGSTVSNDDRLCPSVALIKTLIYAAVGLQDTHYFKCYCNSL